MLKKYFCIILLTFVVNLSFLWCLDFSYDEKAVLNTGLRELGEYRLLYNIKYGLVFFCSPDNLKMSRAHAIYDGRRQYWTKVTEGFNIHQIDLQRLFTQIDLSKTTLQRMEPKDSGILDYLHLETGKLDLSRDSDLKGFMAYLKKNKAPDEYRELILKGAGNPAKRGKLLKDKKINYTEAEVGIQTESMKPIKFKNRLLKQDQKDEVMLCGGMQYYFELHKRKYVRMADIAYNVFRENNPIPLMIVEIIPKDGHMTPMLRGNDLVRRVSKELEEAYHKPFEVTLTQVEWDYDLLTQTRGTPLSYLNRMLLSTVHQNINDEALYLYYFTDSRRLTAFDGDGSHPLQRGAYATDWEKYRHTFLHEFGHTLGLRHHFSQNFYRDKQAYNSLPCVMNYAFRNQEICYLCAYALGIETYALKMDSFEAQDKKQRNEQAEQMDEKGFHFERKGNTLISYRPGGKKKAGEYNFGSMRFIDFKQARDGVIVRYAPRMGQQVIGWFSNNLSYRSEYNMGTLIIKDYVPVEEKVVVHYSKNKGHQYIGAFDRNMKFLGETLFNSLDILSFLPGEEVLVHYRSKKGDDYIGLLSSSLNFVGEYNFENSRILKYHFQDDEILVTVKGRKAHELWRFDKNMKILSHP